MLEKYRIIKRLETGGTSTVFLAKHQLLHTYRAIKCMSKQSLYCKNLLNESIILSQLHHERIPIMYDQDEDNQNYYIIMEFIDGESLKSYVQRHDYLSEYNLASFSLQICEVILYLHTLENPILYLDMKPDNIIVTSQGLKVVDFGSATRACDACTYGNAMGTVGYAAPEQYKGMALDERADIYGIGMVMYYMATKTIFAQKDSIKHIDEINRYSKQLRSVINRCIQENLSHRYQSVQSLMKDLKQLIKRYENNKTKYGKDKSLVIAVAGIKEGVGTTHIALAISKYLNHMIMPSIYVEENNSLHITHMINSKGDFWEQDGIYKSTYLNVLPYQHAYSNGERKDIDLDQYTFIVKDYGVISVDHTQYYKSADICLLVTLSKPWSITNTSFRETRKILGSYTIVVNLTTDNEFIEFLNKSGEEKVYRIAYIGNLLTDMYDSYVWNMIHTILTQSLQTEIMSAKVFHKKFSVQKVVKDIINYIKFRER